MSKIPKYFLYLSDAKVSMLYEQIERPAKTIKTVFSGGAGKWLGAEVSSEFQISKASLYKKFEKVYRWIQKEETISKIDNIGSSWVEDTFPAYISYPVESSLGTPVLVIQWQEDPGLNPLVASKHVLLVGSAAYMMPRDQKKENTVHPLPPGSHWLEVNHILEKIVNNEQVDQQNKNLFWIQGSQDGPFGKAINAVPVKIKTMFRVLQFFKHTGNKTKEFYLGTPLYVEIVN